MLFEKYNVQNVLKDESFMMKPTNFNEEKYQTLVHKAKQNF